MRAFRFGEGGKILGISVREGMKDHALPPKPYVSRMW
jgi:hypothetical protein